MMGKLQEFFIGLNSNRFVFYPGEVLQGYVLINLEQPMEMQGIKLQLEGKAKCHWQEEKPFQDDNNDNKRPREMEDCRGYEDIIDVKLWLYGNGKIKTSHNPGRYSYQFSIQIPHGLPSSFESPYGQIRYELKAKIDRPWKFDRKTKRPFVINEVIDTNLPAYAQGPGGERNKEVGCCSSAGSLHFAANLDRGRYCPGEMLLINANVENRSKRDMRALKAKIVRTIKYIAVGSIKWESKTLSRIDGSSIPKGENSNWQNQPLHIPACLPTINSRIIQVQYYVEIEVVVPRGFNATLKLPITMGTVPYRATYGQPPPANQQMPPPQAPQAAPLSHMQPMDPNAPCPSQTYPSAPPPPPPELLGYPDMAPPSYAAAVGDQAVNTADGDDKHTFGQMSYLPVYTYAQPHQGQNPYGPGFSNPPPMEQPTGYTSVPASNQPGVSSFNYQPAPPTMGIPDIPPKQ